MFRQRGQGKGLDISPYGAKLEPQQRRKGVATWQRQQGLASHLSSAKAN